MNTYIINCIGLAFDIVGAWLIAFEVVYQYKGEKYMSRREPILQKIQQYRGGRVFHPEETDEYKSWEKSKYIKMWSGLSLLTIGFCMQIFSSGLNYLHGGQPLDKVINTQIITNDIINIEPPAIDKDEVGESPQRNKTKPDIQNKNQDIPLKENAETLAK